MTTLRPDDLPTKQESHVLLSNVSLVYPSYNGRQGLFSRRQGRRKGESSYALRDLSIELNAGDRLAVLGRNGAGKSTLLRVMAGIFPPTTGTVQSTGSMALLLDAGFGLDNAQTGLANIKTYAILNNLDQDQARKLTQYVRLESGLGDALESAVRTYSTGMVTRLVFSLATAMTPEILIMDEALSTGDLAFREQAESRLREMVASASILVAASHDLSFLEASCSRAAILDKGTLRAFDTVEEAIDVYRDSTETKQ